MARYPTKPGAWASRPYGPDEDAWEEAKAQCRAALYEWAAAGSPRSYTDLTKRVTAIEWPEGAFTNHGQQMGWLLGQVSLEELVRTEDRPVLSSLVIGQEEGMPTGGYWTFLRDELAADVPASDLARLELWYTEWKAACAYYGRRAREAGD